MRLINADVLYDKLVELEELARDRVNDTPNSLPDGSLNPAAVRYLAQLSERTQLKHMVFDAPTVELDRNTGKWIQDGHHIQCNQCGISICDKDREGDVLPKNFCPNCGCHMVEPQESEDKE